MLARKKIWIDGELTSFGKAKVHVLSHSFGRGSALFEVLSVHPTARGPAAFRLDDHIRRLKNSAKLCYMKLPFSGKAIKQAIKETVLANKVEYGFVKIICYYGGVEFEVVPRRPEVTVAVVAVDLNKDVGAERFHKDLRRPAEVMISSWKKIDPRTVPVEAKSAANYMGGMIAKMEAIEAGYTAPVLLDTDGYLAEGATESLFVVKNGALKTPALGSILPGITRRTVIEVAKDINVDVVEKKMRPAELFKADEAFFTSSVVKAWPIWKAEDKVFPVIPGQITRLIDKVLEKITADKVNDYRKWMTVIKK